MSTPDRHTLVALFPGHAFASANFAGIDTEEFSFTLEVVATARINGNEEPDWLVWMADESKSGNYRNYRTLVILDPYSRKTLDAEMHP